MNNSRGAYVPRGGGRGGYHNRGGYNNDGGEYRSHRGGGRAGGGYRGGYNNGYSNHNDGYGRSYHGQDDMPPPKGQNNYYGGK